MLVVFFNGNYTLISFPTNNIYDFLTSRSFHTSHWSWSKNNFFIPLNIFYTLYILWKKKIITPYTNSTRLICVFKFQNTHLEFSIHLKYTIFILVDYSWLFVDVGPKIFFKPLNIFFTLDIICKNVIICSINFTKASCFFIENYKLKAFKNTKYMIFWTFESFQIFHWSWSKIIFLDYQTIFCTSYILWKKHHNSLYKTLKDLSFFY